MLLTCPLPDLPKLVHCQQEESNWTGASWEMSFRFYELGSRMVIDYGHGGSYCFGTLMKKSNFCLG